MGMFSKKKEPEIVPMGETIQSGPMPNVINADLNTSKEKKEVYISDATKEIDRFEQDIEDRLGAMESVLEQVVEKQKQIIAWINQQSQPRL